MLTDWTAIAAELSPIRAEMTPGAIKRKSRDYFWFSPVLVSQLDLKRADIVMVPADEAELRTLLRYCFRHAIPVTPRGGGTGNYGQAVPLHGGMVIDLSALDTIEMSEPGIVRAGAGARLFDIDSRMRERGWQLRFHPSTWKSASIGGFVAGGATGCGAINFGTLDSPGNIVALRLMTMEAEPRVIELRGGDLRKAIHAYGLTGLITEVEMALAPAVQWHERVVSVGGYLDALRLGDALCRATGIHLNEVAVIAASITRYFRPLLEYVEEGEDLVIATVADSSIAVFDAFVAERGGKICFARGPDAPSDKVPPIYEFCWNHTTLQAINRDKTITYLQCAFVTADPIATVAALIERFGDEVPMHIEFGRIDGDVALMGMPLIRFTSGERLDEIMAAFEEAGCMVYSPHTYMLENGGPGLADPVQFAFKQEVDPAGLLNPGKMPGWPERVTDDADARVDMLAS